MKKLSAANLMVAITSVMVLAAVGGIGLDQAGVIDLTGEEEDPEEPPAEDPEDTTEDETMDPEDESETEETGGEEEEEPLDPSEDETEDPTVTDNGEDETDEDEEVDTEYQDGEMHVSLDEDPVANEFLTATYTEGGDPVQDVEITLGDELGITNEDGEAILQVPEQEEATLETDTGFETTLDIEVVEEPEGDVGEATIGVQSPEDQAEFETMPGDPVQIDFEVTVDSEVQGELSLLVEGEETDSETVEEGISTLEFSEPLTEGSYDWSVEFESDDVSEEIGPYSFEVVEFEPEDDLSLLSDAVSGEHSTVSLYEDGSAVEGEEIFVNGDSIGETDSTGTVSFEVPFEEEITISTASEGFEDATFDVEVSHEEPEITLLSPENGASFETLEGETTKIEFNYEVETSEESGTAELQINGEEYAQTLEQGENTYTETIDLSEGNYNWEVEASTEQHTVTESRGFEIIEVEPEEGLSLQNDPVAEEFNTVILYENDEPVEGETIYVNGDSIGETDELGELDFQVPNVEEITLSTDLSGIESKTFEVDTLEDIEASISSPGDGEVFWIDLEDSEEQVTFEFENPGEEWEIHLNGEETASGTETDVEHSETIPAGDHEWRVRTFQGDRFEQTETREFEIAQEPEIELVEVDVGDYSVELEYDILGESDEHLVKTNGETHREFKGRGRYDTVKYFEEAGVQNVEVQALKDGEVIDQVSEAYETTEPRPFAVEVDLDYDYAEENGHEFHDARLEMLNFHDLNYTLKLDGEEVSSGELDEGENLVIEDLGDLQSEEDYTLEAELSSQQEDENLEFEETFIAEPITR